MKPAMHIKGFLIGDELEVRLKAYCYSVGINQSAFIRNAIEQSLLQDACLTQLKHLKPAPTRPSKPNKRLLIGDTRKRLDIRG